MCEGSRITFCAACSHPGSQLSQSPSLSQSKSKKSHRYSHSRGHLGNLSSATSCPTSPHSPTLPLHLFPSSAMSASPAPRERLYPCTPGEKFVATRNIEASRNGDLTLSKGMEVEGTKTKGHTNGLLFKK